MHFRLTTLLLLLPLSQSAHAQSLSVCSSAASDPDGDGFGWENNQSCRVTSVSDTAPEFINQETGQPVVLTRAIWGAADFEPAIACGDFYFNGSEYTSFHLENLMEFSPVASVAPFTGTVTRQHPSSFLVNESYQWSLDNGIYSGPTTLGETPWVEITADEINAGDVTPLVRIWTTNNSYTRCRPINPRASFIPTGVTTTPQFDGTCIDTDPVGDGWGWNGSTSCRIEGGSTVVSDCVDTVPLNDGWGWNGVASCRVSN